MSVCAMIRLQMGSGFPSLPLMHCNFNLKRTLQWARPF